MRTVSAVPKARPTAREVWSPFFARYDASRVAEVVRQKIEAGERSLRAILDAVGAEELPLSPAERSALRDWDTPEDLDSHSQAR